jgi:hypothetical protein
MKSSVHKIYITAMVLMLFAAGLYLIYIGYSYYQTNLEERFYHTDHELLKPNGLVGHGLGILGSVSMVAGVSIYMLRKRMKSLARLGKLKYWLEFHIFLCTLGPLLVLFHTSFKIGGLVAISFWSMAAVVFSGVIGRFIYIRIPRSIEGRELNLNEIRGQQAAIRDVLVSFSGLNKEALDIIIESAMRSRRYRTSALLIKQTLKDDQLTRAQRSQIIKLVKNEIALNRRIDNLETMQNLFRHWHVAHLPFALIMLIIMIIHVGVSIVFGYTWVF